MTRKCLWCGADFTPRVDLFRVCPSCVEKITSPQTRQLVEDFTPKSLPDATGCP